jgi:hypothetical protein
MANEWLFWLHMMPTDTIPTKTMSINGIDVRLSRFYTIDRYIKVMWLLHRKLSDDLLRYMLNFIMV